MLTTTTITATTTTAAVWYIYNYNSSKKTTITTTITTISITATTTTTTITVIIIITSNYIVQEYVFTFFENPKNATFYVFFGSGISKKNAKRRNPKIPSFRTTTLLTF